MADSKKLMSLSVPELQALGLQYGLHFNEGLRKSTMVQQLMQSQASGWMETNSELSGNAYDDGEDSFYGSSDQISDAAHAAQMLAGAGFTEAFHSTMSGGQMHHVEAIDAYMRQLGTNAQDVWMHMPKANPNVPSAPWGHLNAYMRDTLTGNQDIMPEMQGHYSGDIMAEYSTLQGDVGGSYNYLASMYVDKGSYTSAQHYDKDVANVARRLASNMGPNFSEVAFSSAMGGKSSYMDILPQIGDPSIVGNVAHPRSALNSAGLPLGSTGSAVGGRGGYSLGASLSGMPDNVGGVGSTLYHNVAENMRSLAQAYRGGGDKGMNPYRHVTSDFDQVMDSATRYIGVEEARSGYANLDEPSYSGSTIRQIVENNYDRMESGVSKTFDPAAAARNFNEQMSQIPATGTGFSAQFDAATDYNFARARRESRLIADMDAAAAPNSPVQFHDAFEQGTQEWLDFRKQYDITGSTVGSYLGNNKYVSPIKEMSDKLGYRGQVVQNADMARGHELEPIARARVAAEIGSSISEVGAITNSNFPRMMYSPDGLIGDDAIWEHKAPRKFFDLNDHQDYQDQVQLGMMLSGRNRALFSQTVGSETRSQWVDRDPDWFENNRNKIDSTLARMDAGRRFEEENQDLSPDELKAGVRQTMTGSGIWGFQTNKTGNDYYTAGKRGMSRFDPTAGSSNDEFLSGGNAQSYAASVGATTNVDPSQDRMALSVKTGIIAANEEMKQRRAGSGGFDYEDDADFDDLGSPRGVHRSRFNRANGGGSGSGGGGGGSSGGSIFDNGAFGSILNGIAGGSVQSAQSGFMTSLRDGGPIGQTIALGVGALGVGADAVEKMNDYLGFAQDAGVSNPNAYAAMSQGMEMLGMNQQQAEAMNRNTHSAYNRLANGDPSLAAGITANTRGLITITDIQQAQGDPVALASIFRQRAQERGWSEAQIAGAAEMAGLSGLSRATYRAEGTVSAAGRNIANRQGDDTDSQTDAVMAGNAARALAGTDYAWGRIGMASAPALGAATTTVARGVYEGTDATINGINGTSNFIGGLIEGTRKLESGGDVNAANPNSSARGSMQVLSGTARDPGYGVTPARDNSVAERDRVGADYLNALTRHYDGDQRKAAAAYTDGPGTLDKAVKQYGDDWLSHMPAQAQKRVSDLEKMGVFAGANRFNGNSVSGSPTIVNVELKATINNKQATATVQAPSGETTTQAINVAGGSVMQRR